MKKIVCFAFLTLFLFTNSVFSQDKLPESGMGIRALYQDSHVGIQLPIWISEKINVSPIIGLVYTDNPQLELQFGVSPVIYLRKAQVSPFIGAVAGLIYTSPENGDAVTDYLIGLKSGGEYFVNSHFSIGIEAQLNIALADDKSMRFGNPGSMNINTATALWATIYF